MPKTLAFSVCHADPFTDFEKCLANSRVWYNRRFVSIRPSHFENGYANFARYVSRKRGCNQPIYEGAHGENIAFKVARNAFSVGFEPARYPVFETGSCLVMRETQLPQTVIDPSGEGQLNQSSIVV